MAFGDLPFGMNQIKVALGTVGSETTVRELPAGLTLKFKERAVSARGRGGDQLVALAGAPNGVEWEMEALGISLEAYALMTGGTVTLTPESAPGAADATNVLPSNTGRNPYFNIYGKALGVGADDVHYVISNAKVTEGMDAPLADGEFTKSAFKGLALDWKIVQYETAANLPADVEPEA
jgi:hypothetical protein